jgi:transcriptional pleiotropic regulator of transition state genes
MSSTGIRRKVDDLGRIVIPAGIRRSLGIRDGDGLEVSVEGDRIVLNKPADRCVFCDAEDGPLEAFQAKVVCRPCIAALGMFDERVAGVRDERRDPYDPASTTAW